MSYDDNPRGTTPARLSSSGARFAARHRARAGGAHINRAWIAYVSCAKGTTHQRSAQGASWRQWLAVGARGARAAMPQPPYEH